MNSALKLGLAAAAVVVVALVGLTLLPRSGGVGAVRAQPDGRADRQPDSVPDRRAVLDRLAGAAAGSRPACSPRARTRSCPSRPGSACAPSSRNRDASRLDQGDSLRFTVTVPAGWEGIDTELDLRRDRGRPRRTCCSIGAPGCSPIRARPAPRISRSDRRSPTSSTRSRRTPSSTRPHPSTSRSRVLREVPGAPGSSRGVHRISPIQVPRCIVRGTQHLHAGSEPSLAPLGPRRRWRSSRDPGHGLPGHP